MTDRILIAILILGWMVGCNSGESSSVAAPPALAPPPFEPVRISVSLGQFGGTVELVSTANGGVTLNGEEFSAGQVVGSNGLTYHLSFDGEHWSAVHIPAVTSIDLGTSGQEVVLSQMEDGSISVRGSDGVVSISVTSSGEPQWVRTAGGNQYTLMQLDNQWMAQFVDPPPDSVALGSSGDLVFVQRREDDSYVIGDTEIRSGSIVTAGNGNSYALSTENGVWIATYQEVRQQVSLGASGNIAVVTRSEDGGYWVMDGQPASVGVVTADNGNQYSFLMNDDGVWTARYLPPPRLTVPLGTSGGSVLIDRRENGQLAIAGLMMASGPASGSDPISAIVTASNGNTYELTKVDGGVRAVFQAPPPSIVALGMSGEVVEVTTSEDGNYWVGDIRLDEGTPITSSVGKNYSLSIVNGVWIGTFLGDSVQVPLGRHGGFVTISTAENGSYLLKGRTLVSGDSVIGTLDNEYILEVDASGTWQSTFVLPNPVSVSLRPGAEISVQRMEDGTWTYRGAVVSNGSVITTDSNQAYRLARSEEVWSATYQPTSIEIEGTGLTALTREDGTGFDIEQEFLPLSGTGEIVTATGSYRIWMENDQLFGVRHQPLDWYESTVHYEGELEEIEFVRDDDDTVQNELRTGVIVDGDTHLFNDLAGHGISTVVGDRFVDRAAKNVTNIRNRMEALFIAFPDGGDVFEATRDKFWTAIGLEIDSVFGVGAVQLDSEAPDNDDLFEEIDRILWSLSTQSSLEAEIAHDGLFEGLLEGSDVTVQQVFSAREYEATMSFGNTGTSAYGSFFRKVRKDALSELEYKHNGPGDTVPNELMGAFAYSTSPGTSRSHFVQTYGTAYYEGGTRAVSGDGVHYAGDIAVRVRFSTGRVDGVIVNLESPTGDPWLYLLANVSIIRLPSARMQVNGTWDDDGFSTIRFALQPDTPRPLTMASSFEGELVGGRGVSAGTEVVGTWSVGTQSDLVHYLVGGFAAEREADRPEERPNIDDGGNVEVRELKVTGVGDDTRRLTTLRNDTLIITADRYRWRFSSNQGIGSGDRRIGYSNYQRLPNLNDRQEFEFSLLDLFRNRSVPHVQQGGLWVQIARREIQAIRVKLAALIDSNQLPSAQADLWTNFQNIIGSLLFEVSQISNSEIAYSYEVMESEYALEVIDSVIDALSDLPSLEDALSVDSGGVFTHISGQKSGQPFATRSPIDMWNEPDIQASVWFDATDYTRFGIWSVQRSRNALRSDPDGDGNANSPWIYAESEAFAYSPLEATKYLEGDEMFPRGARATYSGSTLALARGTRSNIEPLPLSGSIEVEVAWDEVGITQSGGAPVGKLTAIISELLDPAGDRPTTASGHAVDELVFPDIVVSHGPNSGLLFNLDSVSVRASSVNRFVPTALVGGRGAINGSFVGHTFDGPLSVLGRWTLDRSAVRHRGNRTVFEGAFGADLP